MGFKKESIIERLKKLEKALAKLREEIEGWLEGYDKE